MAASWPTASNDGALTDTLANNVNINAVLSGSADLLTELTCYLQATTANDVQHLGIRVSALFVILIVSSAVTFFPVLATRTKRFRVPLYFYLFAKYFGAGVIIATGFVHLLDPAYAEIGPLTCVGMTGGWASYSWVPGIALASGVIVFLLDFAAERYVEKKYDMPHAHVENLIIQGNNEPVEDAGEIQYHMSDRPSHSHQHLHSGELNQQTSTNDKANVNATSASDSDGSVVDEEKAEALIEFAFQKQIAAFLILEFGVIFHSVIIGLTLATSQWTEFKILYPVLIFHQSFEGLGVGARLSAIPFPKRLSWMPWALCSAYGLTTPIAIAIGLGIRTTYNAGSFTANVVAGVLDSTSAGILIYTGFVEFLARDFLFNPERTKNDRQLTFMCLCVVGGAGTMALIGKWA